MRLRELTTLLIIIASNVLIAQDGNWGGGNSGNFQKPSFKISGQLFENSSKEPVPFATASVFNSADSSLVTGGLTDEKGFFSVETKPGNYYLLIQSMGYEDVVIESILLNRESPSYHIGKIGIGQDERVLEEIVVETERTQMELSLDKKVFNIGKDLSNLGGSATDILSNLPSVQVDVEGNVSLRGSQNVRILIDGKPSGLVGLSSSDALRQLNSNLVESVELITNPSARYDAEGLGGIINIVLKKDKKKGVNGSYQVNLGTPRNNGASVNMNFRRDWINLFTNLGINDRRYNGSGDSYQRFFDDAGEDYLITNRLRTHDRGGVSYSTRFGADLYLNDLNSITLSFLYRYSDESNYTRLQYFDNYTLENVDSLTLRNDNEGEGDENLEYAINYTRNFKREGHKLTVDIQYQNNNEQESNDLVESEGLGFADQVAYLYQTALNDEIEERIMLQSDYAHPFSKDGMIELGTRYTDRLVGNDYLVEELDENGFYQIDTDFSNEFEYEEKVLALYGIVSNKINKISWQAGLRYELTDLITFQKTINLRNVQNYGDFFPSAFFTYEITPAKSLQASYSRRISRPRGRLLNPFSSISDSRNFRVGNPNLLPEYTDSFEIGFLHNGNNSSIYGGVYYRFTEGQVQRLNTTDENGITFSRPYNVTTEDAYGVEMNGDKEVTKWYSLSGNINLFHAYVSGGAVAFNEEVTTFESITATTLTSRISNNFKFEKLFDGQVNINYQAPRNTVQGKRFSITTVDVGLSRDVLKNNGTIAFNVSDLFNTRVFSDELLNENSYQETSFQWRTTTTTLSFTYRLNQKKRKSRKGGGQGGGYEGGGGDF